MKARRKESGCIFRYGEVWERRGFELQIRRNRRVRLYFFRVDSIGRRIGMEYSQMKRKAANAMFGAIAREFGRRRK